MEKLLDFLIWLAFPVLSYLLGVAVGWNTLRRGIGLTEPEAWKYHPLYRITRAMRRKK